METSTAKMTLEERIMLALNNCEGKQLSCIRLANMLDVSRSAIANKACQARQALDRLVKMGKIETFRGGYKVVGEGSPALFQLPPVGTSGPITEVLPALLATIKTLYPLLQTIYVKEMSQCSISDSSVIINVKASTSELFAAKCQDAMTSVIHRVYGTEVPVVLSFASVKASPAEELQSPAQKKEEESSLSTELTKLFKKFLGKNLMDIESFSVRLDGWKVLIEKDDPNAPKFFRQNNTGRRF